MAVVITSASEIIYRSYIGCLDSYKTFSGMHTGTHLAGLCIGFAHLAVREPCPVLYDRDLSEPLPLLRPLLPLWILLRLSSESRREV